MNKKWNNMRYSWFYSVFFQPCLMLWYGEKMNRWEEYELTILLKMMEGNNFYNKMNLRDSNGSKIKGHSKTKSNILMLDK